MRTLLAAACIVLSAPIVRAEETAPPWLHLGAHTVYDGVTDDLVTGGLGADAMLGKRPGYADPVHPTAAELRRAALFQTAARVKGRTTVRAGRRRIEWAEDSGTGQSRGRRVPRLC
jgi:hydroxybutyrate-dimer hydrolase